MSIRNQHDDYEWALVKSEKAPRPPSHADAGDQYGEPPSLGETLIELAMTIGGFVGVILMIYAVIGAFR